jgi:hypothetical protein
MSNDPMFYDDHENGAREEFNMERAEEILTVEVRAACASGAELTAMVAAAMATPEEFEDFLNGALVAVYRDGRVKAGKATNATVSDEPAPDVTTHVQAISLGVALFNLSPTEALFAAFMAVFVEGHDS